jgi:ABC-type transport system substrate-binding protein
VILPGRRPGRVGGAASRRAPLVLAAAGAVLAVAVATFVPGQGSAATTTSTTNPWVPGVNGTLTVGIDQAPTGCNPNTASGDTWADRFVLEPVLPSSFVVNANDQAVYDPATITQAELQSTSPETVVYTINPKAVWSDGRPLSAQDFIAMWQEERGSTGPIGPTPTAKTTSSKGAGTSPTPSQPATPAPRRCRAPQERQDLRSATGRSRRSSPRTRDARSRSSSSVPMPTGSRSSTTSSRPTS